jgi:protein involved in polysaccharide export with SLBB domain
MKRQNKHSITLTALIIGLIVWTVLPIFEARSQQLSSGQVSEAKNRLSTMSPQEIDQKIKSMGMTREEAEKRAKENGIDLATYLGGSKGKTETDQSPAVPAKSLIESGPNENKAPDNQTPPAETPKQSVSKPVQQSGGLTYFGYDIFALTPSSFEPNASGPVDADYQIGPEDILRVTIWGQVEQQNEAEVDKDGRIFIPTAGPVVVSGLTLDQANKVLTRQLSRSFQGLASNPATVWLDVTLAKIRPKRVFIMGEVGNPGGYTVNSYANVFNTLFSVGGPTVNGSLREVRLIRGNKVVAKVDLYSYLTGADKNNDVRVQSNDIVYVPVRKSAVSVKGGVRKPGIYELLPTESMQKLLEFAGGPLTTAYLERIQVERITAFKDRKKNQTDRQIIDINYRELISSNKDFKLEDGDEVTVYTISEMVKNYATISGAVFRGGSYQLQPNMRIRDLIMLADSLQPYAYMQRADILRTRPDKSLEAKNINLGLAMSGDPAHNILLDSLDQIKIYSKYDVEITDGRTVSIAGHVRIPGTFPFTDSLTLFDLIFQAGGLQDSLYRAETFIYRGELVRLSSDNRTKITIPFDLKAIIDSIPGSNIPLKQMDQVFINSIEVGQVKNEFVEIRGNVRKPGRYPLTRNMSLTDVLMLAGGFTEEAWSLQAEISRLDRKKQDDTISYIYIAELPDLRDTASVNSFKYFQDRSGKDFLLKHRDHIFIRPDPNFQSHKIVSVEGEVRFPGDYALRTHNEYLSDVLLRAGGVTAAAYLRGGRLMRNGERVNFDFQEVMDDPRGDEDVVLHNNDQITIPKKPNSVRMEGEIFNPGILGFIDGDDLWDYIDRAGGLTDSADYVILIHPNGNAEQFGTGWFGGDAEVYDGSTVFVKKVATPTVDAKQLEIGNLIRDLFAIAASALTILVLARQL